MRRTMREVVAELRNENAEAMLELYEFEYAMTEVRRHLEGLASAVRELEPSIAKLAGAAAPSDAEQVVQHAAYVARRAEQIAGAFREFCRGLSTWGITEAN